MATASSGLRVLVENDDKAQPDQLYAESHYAQIYTNATGMQINMAGTAAVKDFGEDQAAAGTLEAGLANGCTADAGTGATSGEITLTKGGVYRLEVSGRIISDSASEDIVLEWYADPNGGGAFAALGEPHEIGVHIGEATDSQEANIGHVSYYSASPGDIVKLTVLGQDLQQITFQRFNVSVQMVQSENYET